METHTADAVAEELGLQPYLTSDQIARMIGNGATNKDVSRWAIKLQLEPDLTLGARQWRRDKAVLFLLLARLQEVYGDQSPVPFATVKQSGAMMAAQLLNGEPAQIIGRSNGVEITITLASLAELLAA